MRTVLVVLGMLLFLSCAVLIVAGWRDPGSRFLTGMVQNRHNSGEPAKRTSAAACWLILGLAAGSVGVLVSLDPDERLRDASVDDPAGYVCAVALLACFAVAGWIRFADAPQSLRPAAMRDSSA